MYFQLEVDYYSNETNKNKYKDVQLIASTKNNLKIATDCTGHCTCNYNLSYLSLGLQSTLLLGLKSIFIELESTLLLESYVCFSKMFVALYQFDICKKKPTLSFITLVPNFILYYPQMWLYHFCIG